MYKFASLAFLRRRPLRICVCILLFAICGMGGAVDWESEGRALTAAGKYSAAARAFERAIADASSKAEGRQLVGMYASFAQACALAGEYTKAAGGYRHALALEEKVEGRDSLNYALLLSNMSSLPVQSWNNEEAITIVRKAIAVHGESRSAEYLAALRGFLGHALLQQKRYQEAEPLLVEAGADLTKLKSRQPELLSKAFNDLGLLRFEQKRYTESIDSFRESVRVLEAGLGAEHASLASVLNNLASTYAKMGRLDDADVIYQRAITICGKTLGDDHPIYGTLLRNYAVVLRKLGRRDEAKKMKVQSARIERASDRRNGVGATVDASSLR